MGYYVGVLVGVTVAVFVGVLMWGVKVGVFGRSVSLSVGV